MRHSKILARIRAGEPVRLAQMGYFIPPFIAYAAHEGYDGVWLDLEHHAMNPREVQALLAFFHKYDIDCIIRPSTREKGQLYRYLEDGAVGLMMPHVSNADTACQIVNNVRFPPLGDRGIEGFGFEANFGLDTGNLVEHANRETAIFVQIETPEAVENLDAIAAVPGIDGLYIGPGDLGIRMALEPEEKRLDRQQVMERVAEVCRRHGKIWGIYALHEADLLAQMDIGAHLLVWGADFLLLKNGLNQSRQTLEDTLKRLSQKDSS